MRVPWLALVGIAAVLAAPADAGTAALFRFDRSSATPNDRLTIRTSAAPKTPVRLYLVPRGVAGDVHSRFDGRLSFIGSIAQRTMSFSVPPLDAGEYALAYRSPGRPLVVQRPMRLQIRGTAACPVTLPNGSRPPGQPRNVPWYGNGLLWAGLSRNGVYAAEPDQVGADRSIGNKLLWATTPAYLKPVVSGERLDAPAAPLLVLRVNRGSFSGAEKPSYMTPVIFPTAGCWRVTARVGDVSLTYVVSVMVR